MRYFILFLLLFCSSFLVANDYSFFITGKMQPKKIQMPNSVYSLKQRLDFFPEKKSIDYYPVVEKVIIKEKDGFESSGITFMGTKKIEIIEVKKVVPERFLTDEAMFSENEIALIVKPSHFQVVSETGEFDIVQLAKKRDYQLEEIEYVKKQRRQAVFDPPEYGIQVLEDQNKILENGIQYAPLKPFDEGERYLYAGYTGTNQYYLGYLDNNYDLRFSNGINRVYFSHEESFAGAEFSENILLAEASIPDFKFRTTLDSECFTLSLIKDQNTFEYGLGVINLYPLPIVNWYSGDFGGGLSLGCDFIADHSYGVNFKITNFPYSFGISSGYNFEKEAFHGLIKGAYKYANLFLNSSLQYCENFDLSLGVDYYLINKNPWFLKIYGNIGYSDNLSVKTTNSNFIDNFNLFFGTKIDYDDYKLDFNVNYDTGGLKFNVEAGYTF